MRRDLVQNNWSQSCLLPGLPLVDLKRTNHSELRNQTHRCTELERYTTNQSRAWAFGRADQSWAEDLQLASLNSLLKKKKKKSFLWCSLISNFIPRFLSFSASPLLFPCVGFNRKFYRTRLYSQSVIKTARLSFSLHKPLDGSNCLDFLHHKALCQPAI